MSAKAGIAPQWQRRELLPVALASPLLLFLLAFFIWPVVQLLGLSFGESGFTLENYTRLAQVPLYRRVFANTFFISATTTVLCIFFSYPVAYLLATVSDRTRKILFVMVLLPFWTSALVRTAAWIVILQRNGILNSFLTSSGIIEQPLPFVYNLSGVLIGMTHVLMPFVVLPLYAAFRNIDNSLILAASGLGANNRALASRIVLPLTASGVIAGGTIVFMNALGYYITPALMGGPGQTMVSMLIAQNINTNLNWGIAAALSVVLLVLTLGIFVAFQRAFGMDRLFSAGGGRGASQSFGGAGGRSFGGWVAALCGVLVLLVMIAPIVIVFPMSLSSSPFLKFPPDSYSIRWFQNLLSDPKWIKSIWNSAKAASIAVPLSVVLGTAAALGVSRTRQRFRVWLDTLFVMPMVVPIILLAVGLYYVLAPFKVLGNPYTLGLAQSVLGAPYVFLTVRAALKGFDPSLELAALNLGASWLTMFRRVLLPAIAPGIIAGSIFAFIQSFDDVVLALFLTNVRSRTLPRAMYEGLAHEIDPTINAASALIILLTIVVLLINLLLSRRTTNA
ncbi:ABC transporter permease subunit [Paracoccus suum]|uniref:ABC transporter permease subunit n=1 Tax=Paracoccus suum TaxID=2259340 RepID=A0A344PMA7_9RHOB|nr:ABC transporter permease subunit [Paracoccus suum]AXC50512.1 ABC transporter permease subunit [Paracoccus suum]